MATYKPLGLIQNAFSGLPSWYTEMPDLDLNRAIQNNLKTEAAMRENNEAEEIANFYEENPDASWETSRDQIERIAGKSGDVSVLASLANMDSQADARKDTKEKQERAEILQIAKYDPETAKLLWEAKGYVGSPNFTSMATKTKYSGGRQIIEHPDGTVTIKKLYETGSGKQKNPVIMYNAEGDQGEFPSTYEAKKAGYAYSQPRDELKSVVGKAAKELLEETKPASSGEKKWVSAGGFSRKSSPNKKEDDVVIVRRKK